MLISRDRNRWKEIDAAKVSRGSFLTKRGVWLQPQVRNFLLKGPHLRVLDPFAGAGHLLREVREVGIDEVHGYDIDPRHGWQGNDSLQSIPDAQESIIVTNPPYLARHSAKRKRVYEGVSRHFVASPDRSDLYQIALDRCRAAARRIIAIVPETFLNSGYPVDELESVTILEENPFTDTDCPVCVVCFDKHRDLLAPTLVYKNATPLGELAGFNAARLHPDHSVRVIFNVPSGRLALRAVDFTGAEDRIAFMQRKDINYDVRGIKVSSRLVTFIEVPSLGETELPEVVSRANGLLESFRALVQDVVLSPFKGNTRDGRRRRRLDYYTARAILERAVADARMSRVG